ncbi:uncharacterized protein LOC101453074 [Ceratitis capitata]|uniref:(Mediterranean fruit fly) hypothetical protein n=1 Tax=Ceratitis capitata TaxID=7213 RepID=W8C883_CERCA|nr:uncharacterized protein LOC101453074 [Ceratitis capitata]CAD6998629.1 unnamed protein product [Ceratitis capitata]
MDNSGGSESIGGRRKSIVWTREKINQLIELYQQHECLWNPYTEAYKNKDKRTKAISNICTNLHITKMDFGKKIHNLRNQFNSEMKKLERRVEETGDDLESVRESCRWKHFQALKFLQNVIEPRPGGYQSKMRKINCHIKYDTTSDEDAENFGSLKTKFQTVKNKEIEYQFDDTTLADSSVCILDNAVVSNHVTIDDTRNLNEQSNVKPTTTTVSGGADDNILHTTNERLENVNYPSTINVSKNFNQNSTLCSKSLNQDIIIEESHRETCLNCSCQKSKQDYYEQSSGDVRKKSLDDNCVFIKSRDQWDAFGELIATEFRHLNSDTSRKKLKRKIMQAMVEVGEEDDSSTL